MLADQEFVKLARAEHSLTHKLACRWRVDPETFASWRWQMAKQVTNEGEAEGFIELKQTEKEGFAGLEKLFHAGISPYYLGLIAATNSLALRKQVIPSIAEVSDRLGTMDPLEEKGHSPVQEVVHLYPDRVAFCVAHICPVYCRYCFRKRRGEETGLHFNRKVISRGLEYIASNSSIRDVLITGGDPFIANDGSILSLLEKIRKIKHVEIVRFGTRTPVALPYRITDEFCKKLAKYHPIWVNTHFNCAEEITPEAEVALAYLVNHGFPVGNQAVLLKGVNDSTSAQIKLSQKLTKARVRPYYLFHPHNVEGTEHLRVSVKRGLEIMKEMRGNISGFAIPTYALDTPSGKIPLLPDHVLGIDGQDLILEGLRGDIWREVGVYY